MLRIVERRAHGFAVPVVGARVELTCSVVGDPRIPVQAIVYGQPLALLFPCSTNAGSVASRCAFERVEQQLAPAARLHREIVLRERTSRVALDRHEVASRDPAVQRKVLGNDAREAHVARLRRQAEPRPAIGRR